MYTEYPELLLLETTWELVTWLGYNLGNPEIVGAIALLFAVFGFPHWPHKTFSSRVK